MSQTYWKPISQICVMYNRQKFLDTFTPCVISVLLISVVVAIIADFQTHFGFEHIAYAEFVTHPMMFFRHLLEALFASLIVPFFSCSFISLPVKNPKSAMSDGFSSQPAFSLFSSISLCCTALLSYLKHPTDLSATDRSWRMITFAFS